MDQLCRLLRRATREGWDGVTLDRCGYIAFYGAGIARDGSDQFDHQDIPADQCTEVRDAIERRLPQEGMSEPMTLTCPIANRYGYREMCAACLRQREARKGMRVPWHLTWALSHMACATHMHPYRGLAPWTLSDWCRRLIDIGMTWDDVGAMLGVSAKTAQKHLGERQ